MLLKNKNVQDNSYDKLLVLDTDKKILHVVCSGSQVDPNSMHWKTLGLPVYALDSALQATQPN